VHDQTTGGLRRIAYTAHNHYIQTLSSLGLLGLLGFLATFAYALTGLYRLSRLNIGGGVTQALLVLLLMQAVYYIPYSTDYFQHLILGMALAYVQSHQAALKERAAPTTPPVTRASGLWRLA
jgi:O-antigen ligase